MGSKKLTCIQRKAILTLYTGTKHNCMTISKIYGYHVSTVCKILKKNIEPGEYEKYKRVKYLEAMKRRYS